MEEEDSVDAGGNTEDWEKTRGDERRERDLENERERERR
jgi:hypothetical protein